MKSMIFGALLFIGGLMGVIAIICSSLISQTRSVYLFGCQLATVLDFFIILTVIGVAVFFNSEIKKIIKKGL